MRSISEFKQTCGVYQNLKLMNSCMCIHLNHHQRYINACVSTHALKVPQKSYLVIMFLRFMSAESPLSHGMTEDSKVIVVLAGLNEYS